MREKYKPVKWANIKHLIDLLADNNFKPIPETGNKLPTKQEIEDTLSRLPAVQCEESEVRWKIVTGREYVHSDYWLTVGMALYNYSALCGNE